MEPGWRAATISRRLTGFDAPNGETKRLLPCSFSAISARFFRWFTVWCGGRMTLKTWLRRYSSKFSGQFGVTISGPRLERGRVRSSRLSYFWELSEESRRVLEAGPEAGEKAMLTIEDQTALKEIVGKLLDRAPAEDRAVVVLKDIESLSVEEIAATMNWTISKVKVRLHRARKRMLADLKRWR
jgi:RNA polymerase sigma factor (sigma-70 family)